MNNMEKYSFDPKTELANLIAKKLPKCDVLTLRKIYAEITKALDKSKQ